MKRLNIACVTLLTLLLPIAHAAGDADLRPCVDMQNKATAERELDCYRQIASDSPSADQTSKPILSARATGLEQEWAPSNATLVTHKLNYALIYAKSSQTNNAPGSPNPQNQVLTALPQDDRDMKVQLSMKHDLADFDRYGSLWAGYTLLSFWQVYDESHSRPFRENNYEPELIYSINPNQMFGESRLNPSILNIGVVHQSNGQANPRSRSWNRIYVQTGIERNFPGDRKLVVLVRGWKRISEDISTDDNPDITHYLGHGDIELRYSQNKYWEATLTLKSRSAQLDLAAPWTAWRLLTLASPGKHNTNIHLHYFSGYGESLIDYNQRHDTWGVGLSFPFE
ncbi:MAG: phospholipase A [Gallionella sp.]|nr:phospholipase A [Gallionella sp.]